MKPRPAPRLRLVAGAMLALLAAAPAGAELVNRILATIDGEPVTLYELKQFAQRDLRTRQAAPADQADLLDLLITERIIQLEVTAEGIVVRDEDVDQYIEGIAARNQLTDEQLRAALAQQGISWDRYRAQLREELQKAQLINREIRGKVNVTPEEVQRYYAAHLDQYATPEQVGVSHIVLRLPPDAPAEQVDAVTRRAEDLHARLTRGADFAELAREHSEDSAAASGGKLGTFKRGEMLDAFEEVAMSLQPGQISRPFRTEVGVHIVRVDERAGASHQPLETLAADIKERLYNAALEERYNRWLREDLRQRHSVEMRP